MINQICALNVAKEQQILASFPGLPTIHVLIAFHHQKLDGGNAWEGSDHSVKESFISLQRVWLATLTLLSDIFESLLLRSEPSFEGVGGGVVSEPEGLDPRLEVV